MTYTEPIRKNKDFKRLYKNANRFSCHLFALYIMPNCDTVNRLGISVSRKVGCSVVRNRVKRRVKESYRLAEKDVAKGYDIIVAARVAAGQVSQNKAFNEINRALLTLLKKTKLL